MKRFFTLLLSVSMLFTLSTTAFAADSIPKDDKQIINREVLNKIRCDTPALSEEEAKAAIDFISEYEKTLYELSALDTSNRDVLMEKADTLKSQMKDHGVIPLSIEDIYALSGRTYRPGAPDVPNDTNYVHFYGLTAYVGNYEVWNIVASSTGFSQSAISVPFYTSGTATIYNQAAYVRADFSKYIDMATSVASSTFAQKAFNRLPVLNYISDVWDLATFFNPTAQQKITADYDCAQIYIYSYVASSTVGYFDFVMSTERKTGSCALISRVWNGGPTIRNLTAGNFIVNSAHYADYSYAVQLYQQGSLNRSFSVGNIQIKLDSSVAATISMSSYPSLWTIPGI